MQGSREDVDPAAVTVADVWDEGLAGEVADGNWTTGEVAGLDSRFVVLTSA